MAPILRASFEGTGVEDVRKLKNHFSQSKSQQDPEEVSGSTTTKQEVEEYEQKIVWYNVFRFTIFHLSALIGIYQLITVGQWKTIFWTYLVAIASMLGVTVGAHRLWCHRSYKAKLPLRILLAFFQTISYHNDIYGWCKEHRVHHKYVDTDADPHNAKRGLFFSQIGWVMVKKHKDVLEKGKNVDFSDILADPVVKFQRKYFKILTPVITFFLPAWVPWYFWNEDVYVAFFVASMLRFVFCLHAIFSVNSIAHMWGTRPYDNKILPTENLIAAILSNGEGWHNYHHVFPWDYKASELGTYSTNLGTAFIDLMAKIGWAYDLKSASDEMIKKRMARTGDLSFLNNPGLENSEEIVWGWNDKDMKSDDKDLVKIQCRKQK